MSLTIGTRLMAAVGLVTLPAMSCAQPTQEPDGIQQYEQQLADDAYENLMGCWMRQWPQEVKHFEGPNAASEHEIAEAAAATRAHCEVEKGFYLSQVRVDLARQGMTRSQIESAAEPAVDAAIEGLFDEYWARL